MKLKWLKRKAIPQNYHPNKLKHIFYFILSEINDNVVVAQEKLWANLSQYRIYNLIIKLVYNLLEYEYNLKLKT